MTLRTSRTSPPPPAASAPATAVLIPRGLIAASLGAFIAAALQTHRLNFLARGLRRRSLPASGTLAPHFTSFPAFASLAAFIPFATSARARALAAIEIRGVALLFHEIGDVEKRVALQADVHKTGLHARQHTRYASVINRARESVLILALVIDLSEFVLFDDRQPRLMRRAGDINFI
jgi:hypothetical protein